MVQRDLYRTEAHDRERQSLNQALRGVPDPQGRLFHSSTAVGQALSGVGLYDVEVSRDEVRVLFVSQDESLLNPTQQTLDGLIALSSLFHEVHILILRTGIRARFPVLRVAPNVWLYTAAAKAWWWTPIVGLRLLRTQLEFLGELRPDLIVARDPFESALVAWLAGRKYERPVQVHVLEDYTDPTFVSRAPHNRLRRWLASRLLRRVDSIRTDQYAIAANLRALVPEADVAVLPRYTDYTTVAATTPTIDLESTYKPHTFFAVYGSSVGADSSVGKVLRAMQPHLKNPRVALLLVGGGSHAYECEHQARVLGISHQVIVPTSLQPIAVYIHSAQVLIVSDTDRGADELTVLGAALGVPLVIAHTQFRNNLFVHEQSALFFRADSVEELQERLGMIINNASLRRRLVLGAQAVVAEHFHSDRTTYEYAYRQSIEAALLQYRQSESAKTPHV
jgi:glycosyltransferase involved in cell wall biosynthesis